MPDLLLQVVEESDSSAIFTIGMVVVYGECTISEVSRSALSLCPSGLAPAPPALPGCTCVSALC